MSEDASTQLRDVGPAPGTTRRVLVTIVDDVVATFALPERGEVIVGRGRDVGITIDHPSVSRSHLALELDAAIRVRDLGSANGTSLRGARLPPQRPVEVGPNETFVLGDVAAVVQERRATSRPAAAPRPPEGRRGAAIAPVVLEPAMQNLFELVRRVAAGTISVLITGESGVGKEVVAEALHRSSPRGGGPLIRINCAAIADPLFESELFGHERGAFTGAATAKVGLVEAADGGTVFLDEVGELAPALQGKLLRVIEDRKVTRVGAVDARAVDVRFVAATNRELEAEVAAGRFREDLYYRLAGVVLEVPPLRERRRELEPLARAFAAAAAGALGRATPSFGADALAALQAHAWPGNVRELRNAIERAVLLAGDELRAEDLLGGRRPAATAAPPLAGDADERARIVAALERCAGNQTRAATQLGMPLRTLVKRIGQYRIPRPKRG